MSSCPEHAIKAHKQGIKNITRDVFFAKLSKGLEEYIKQPSSSPKQRATRKRDVFRIGVVTSLTGIWAKGGYNTKRGYDIWADMVNSRDGIKVGSKRYPVQLIYCDDESRPDAGSRIIEELLTKGKIDFIFGPYSSAVTLAIAPAIDRFHIPHITGSAEADEILEKGFDWTFGVLLGNVSSVRAPLKIWGKQANLGVATTAIIGADDIFSKSITEAFRNAALEFGLRIEHYEIFPVDVKDISPVIRRVKEKAPEALAVGGHIDNLINTVRTTRSLHFSPETYVMHYGVASQDFVNALGAKAEHILGVSQWSPEANFKGPVFGTAKEFHDLFMASYNREPDQIEAGCSATGSIFQQIVEKTGVIAPLGAKEKKTLRDQLQKLEFETFFGPINFHKRIL